LYRLWKGVFLGKEIDKPLHYRVRAHGNAAEWLAPSVFALAFLELQGAPSIWLHVLGGSIVGVRVLHASFMLSRTRLTIGSAVLLYTVTLVTAAWALALRLHVVR